ncbi:MAG: glycosyltransferase family 4 protein [Chloroflexi bacterium]|nr:glycosyltransferase family 4 protein [Chloroflexota bacterium]
MRAGLLIYGSLNALTGGYLYDRKLVEHLGRQGDAVSIVSLPWRNYIRHLGDNFSLPLLRRLEALSLDVLLQDELNHPSVVLLNRRLRASARYPIVSIVHNLRSSEARPCWQKAFYRWVERHYLTGVDGFVFNSRTTRRVVEDLVGKGRPSVVAYPAGDRLHPEITDGEIAARASEPGPLRIVFLANVLPGKGLHTLLAAMEQLPMAEFSLRVAGSLTTDGPYVRAIRRRLDADGLAGQVSLLGLLSADALIPELRSGHVLVVPSFYEGFGIAYLEGMGFGLPAIATTAGAAVETIAHGVNGFLVEPGDAAALAAHLLDLSRDRQRLLEMSFNARRRYLAHPTWDMTSESIRSFLESLLSTSDNQTALSSPAARGKLK